MSKNHKTYPHLFTLTLNLDCLSLLVKSQIRKAKTLLFPDPCMDHSERITNAVITLIRPTYHGHSNQFPDTYSLTHYSSHFLLLSL